MPRLKSGFHVEWNCLGKYLLLVLSSHLFYYLLLWCVRYLIPSWIFIVVVLVISKVKILTFWAFGNILVCLPAMLGAYILVSYLSLEIHSLGHSSLVNLSSTWKAVVTTQPPLKKYIMEFYDYFEKVDRTRFVWKFLLHIVLSITML